MKKQKLSKEKCKMYGLRRNRAPESVLELSPVLKVIKSLKQILILDGIKWLVTSGQDLTLSFHLMKKEINEILNSKGQHLQQKADEDVIELGS